MPLEWSSRLLEAAAYDRSQALLQLSFRNGASYRYSDVPAEVYDQLLLAESKGKYFNLHIRNRYAYTKISASSESASCTLDR
jgi:lysyl-tRNA synthetase, class II